MNILTELYTDIRKYLIELLEISEPRRIVRAYNNGVPIPIDAIIMSFRSDGHLDQFSSETIGDKLITFNSVSGTMQLDFYGSDSFDLAQKVATCWNTSVTTDILINCAPLNQPRIRDLTFVNESGQYELRFMLELELQFNTRYEKTVNITTEIKMEHVNAI